jgi:hypothetical protein
MTKSTRAKIENEKRTERADYSPSEHVQLSMPGWSGDMLTLQRKVGNQGANQLLKESSTAYAQRGCEQQQWTTA